MCVVFSLRGEVLIFIPRSLARFVLSASFVMCVVCNQHDRIGDMANGLFLPKMMMYNLQMKLGLVPDFMGMHEVTANTSLVFHAGGFPTPPTAQATRALRDNRFFQA